MMGILSRLFGGSKSEKDIKSIQPLVGQIRSHYTSFAALSNDALRQKTQEFKARVQDHLNFNLYQVITLQQI